MKRAQCSSSLRLDIQVAPPNFGHKGATARGKISAGDSAEQTTALASLLNRTQQECRTSEVDERRRKTRSTCGVRCVEQQRRGEQHGGAATSD
jgi:hypothetical protein